MTKNIPSLTSNSELSATAAPIANLLQSQTSADSLDVPVILNLSVPC